MLCMNLKIGTNVTQLADLLQQQATLAREIEALRQVERSRAIAEIRRLMAEFSLLPADVAGRVTSDHPSGRKHVVAVKFRDAMTGETWTGRGLTPKWLAARLAEGKSREDFAV